MKVLKKLASIDAILAKMASISFFKDKMLKVADICTCELISMLVCTKYTNIALY